MSVPNQPHENDQPEHERRVKAVLKRARRETGARDLLTFGLATMWTTLLSLGTVLYVLFANRRVRPTTKPTTST